MGVITKPSSVQRLVIVRLLGACGMAAGYGGDYSQRSPREAVYRRHGLLPRAQHALLLTQTVHKKRGLSVIPSISLLSTSRVRRCLRRHNPQHLPALLGGRGGSTGLAFLAFFQ